MRGPAGPLVAREAIPLTTFTADALARLGGPDWLQDRRRHAFERFGRASLPTSEEEVWRYSRVAELDLDDFTPVVAPPEDRAVPGDGGVPADLQALLDAVPERAAAVVVVDGRVVHVELDPGLARKGVAVGRLVDLADGDEGSSLLGSVATEAPDAFGELHAAFVADPVLVRVPAGVVVPAPILVLHWAATEGGASFPHLVVRAGDDSEVTVYDHQASADVRALVVPLVELDARPAARLRYVNAQVLGRRVWQLGRQASTADRDATLSTGTVALGGDYARVRLDSTMAGRGASGEMLAVYFGEEAQMHDFRTLQDHVAPQTTSNLLFKGAVQGRSRSVYTGLIHIGKQAAGVNAFQTNRNLKLSDGAWAESVPNLEIENNDVRCSHASAVGPVDEEQRFYLESRGVPTPIAERLVVLGFFEEVLDRLPVPAAMVPLRRAIADKLGRRELPAGMAEVGA